MLPFPKTALRVVYIKLNTKKQIKAAKTIYKQQQGWLKVYWMPHPLIRKRGGRRKQKGKRVANQETVTALNQRSWNAVAVSLHIVFKVIGKKPQTVIVTACEIPIYLGAVCL